MTCANMPNERKLTVSRIKVLLIEIFGLLYVEKR